MLAPIVKEVAPSLLLERMQEELALQVARYGHPPDDLEVLPRLLISPGRASRVERLQTQGRAGPMTGDASGVAGTLVEKDGLDLGLEIIEIERRRCRRGRGGLLTEHTDQHQRPEAERYTSESSVHAP